MSTKRDSRVAAPTPETPSPWQPIETVPDGTDFIIAAYQRHGKSEVGEAFSDGRRWIAAVLNDHIEPTHWMPLPDPPLAGAVSQPQPDPRTTNDDEVARGDRRGSSVGFGTAGSDAGAQDDSAGGLTIDDVNRINHWLDICADRATTMKERLSIGRLMNKLILVPETRKR